MSGFDALAHSFSTLSTGGYSTHDASLAYFNSRPIEAIAVVFMLIGGISFSVHYTVWRTLRPTYYARDAQLRTFLIVVAVLSLIVGVLLYATREVPGMLASAWTAVFEAVSVLTSTGFAVADFSLWPLALPVLLIFASFIGGCAGSTAGGIKVIRFMIVGKQALAHIRKLIHPQSVNPIRVGDRTVEPSIIDSVWGFFTIYVIVFAVLMVGLTLDGMDQVTAFGAVATALNNLGPGLGKVAVTFAGVGAGSKALLVFAMIAGRLEIFTLLVLFTPAFWRR
jgi:trk system potassium uptake protein TrkH